MAVTGKTKQFQSLSNQVKSQSQSQEPLISTDQITQLFDDFGYQPERADLTYWSHQPETAKTKLVNELKSRRDEEKTAQKENQAKQQGPSHLTNQQITSIYSEYGFPTPKSSSDFEWIRQNFPDDENKIRTIFDEKRKQMDQMMKVQGKNMIDNVKQQSMTNNQSNVPSNTPILNNQGGQGGLYNGQGGPSDGQGAGTSSGTQWSFPSRYNVIKFTGDPNGPDAEGDASTLWLLDSQDKSIRPFLSMNAFQNFYGDNAAAALKKVVNMDPNDLINNGPGADFQLYGTPQGINENGQVPATDATRQQLSKNYGQPEDPAALQQGTYAVDGLFDLWISDKGSGLNVNGIQEALSDPIVMEKYARAITSGGYNVNDVYSDLKRKELIKNGDQSLTSVQVIDPTMTKTEYLKTNPGQISQGIATLTPPSQYGNINSSVFNNPITQGTSGLNEIMKILVPPLDMTSPEVKSQMEQVQSAFHDILSDQINATTESQKAQADQKYQDYRDYVEKNYGIRMSQDIVQGWQQIQQIMSQSGAAGLSGSGIEANQIDSTLREVRTQDKRWRELQNKDIDMAQDPLTQSSASPSEIQKMNQEDQAAGLPKKEWRAYKLGLVPSDETLASLDINALKQKYPNASEAELQAMRSQILDENGNYRSTLYQNKADQLAKIQSGGTLSDNVNTVNKSLADQINRLAPGSITSYDGSKDEFQRLTVQLADLQKRQKAESPYLASDPNNPLAGVGSTTPTPKNTTTQNQFPVPTQIPQYDSGAIKDQANIDMSKISDSAKNISQTLSNPPVSTVKTSNPTAPAGSVAINGAKYNTKALQQSAYSNIQPIGNTLYGMPKTPSTPSTIQTPQTQSTPIDPSAGRIKIPNLNIMGTYKPDQYDRIGTSVYLKSGVKQNW